MARNAARCRLCGDEIESKHRHDFVRCSCGALALDGGQDYQRVVLGVNRPFDEVMESIE